MTAVSVIAASVPPVAVRLRSFSIDAPEAMVHRFKDCAVGLYNSTNSFAAAVVVPSSTSLMSKPDFGTNLTVLVALAPFGVVTITFQPVVPFVRTPAGTVAVICVAESTVTEVNAVFTADVAPFKSSSLTELVQRNEVPVIVRVDVPVLNGVVPFAGLVLATTTFVTVGAGATGPVVKTKLVSVGDSESTAVAKPLKVIVTLSPALSKSVGGFIVQVSFARLVVDQVHVKGPWLPD